MKLKYKGSAVDDVVNVLREELDLTVVDDLCSDIFFFFVEKRSLL